MKKTTHIAPINKSINKKYSIIIPAAGQGTRMKSYGPKSLIKIKDKTIIEHQVRAISKSLKNFEIVLVAGFESNKVIRKCPKNVKVVTNDNYLKTNTCESIKIGLQHINTTDVIIVYGDLVCNLNSFKAPFGFRSMMITDPTKIDKDEVGCSVCSNSVEHVIYGMRNRWAQIVYLTDFELSKTKELISYEKYKMKTGFELINDIIELGGSFLPYSPKDIQTIDIDSSKDIETAEKIV